MLDDLTLETRLTTAGRQHDGYFGAVNPPVYRTSTLVHPSFQAFKKGLTIFGRWTDYSRNGSPSVFALQDALSSIMPGVWDSLPTPSGISAITTTLLALLGPGDHILVTDSVYAPVRVFCDTFLQPRGICVTYYDPLAGEEVAALIQSNTRLLYLEQPGSLTFDMQDVLLLVRVAKAYNLVTVLDSTWASPLYYNPLQHGVDVVVQSLSKYVAGHADVMMGAISTGNKAIHARIEPVYRSLGICISPDDAYLVLRGLRTLAVRMRQHMEAGLVFARWLQAHPCIARVYYPALETDPGHLLWKRDFTGAPGLFSATLKPCSEEALASAMDRLRLFVMGQSWGGYESVVYPVLTPPVRTVCPWPQGGTLLRLHIGLESVADLQADFAQACQHLEHSQVCAAVSNCD